MAKISVIGSGGWGIALTILLHKNGHELTVWSFDKKEAEELKITRENKAKLANILLPEDIVVTDDLKEAVTDKDILVLAVPSKAVRSVSKSLKDIVKEKQIIVNVAKGLEEDTLATMTDIIEEELKDKNPQVAVLSGPSHAEEVGIVIGFILLFFSIVFSYVLSNLSFSAFLPIIILVVILTDLISTGALHLDGLADTFDGIFSYRSKHKMLEIMKDSRLGSNGALALILYFLIKFVLLYSLLMEDQGETVFAVLTYPVVARLCSVISCASAPYARGSGMGKTFVDNTKASGVIIASLITVVYSSAMLFYMINSSLSLELPLDFVMMRLGINLLIIAILGLFAFSFSKLIERKIGGITGDTLGALLEISSLVYLFLIIVVPTFFL